MEKEKVLHLAYLKDMLENSYSEDSGTFAIAVKVLELLRDEGYTIQNAKHILTACGSSLFGCNRKEILKNYEFALPTEIALHQKCGKEMSNKAKETLEKQLELLSERSLLCDDASLAPITEQLLDIVRLL